MPSQFLKTSLLILLFIVRFFFAAQFQFISDADEAYNYWEPTHYLLYGNGFQTWEYSPQFALRSWSYISFWALAGKILAPFLGWGAYWQNPLSSLGIFFTIRRIFAIITVSFEYFLYQQVKKYLSSKKTPYLGEIYLFFSLISTGMFHASVSYLPNSFALYGMLITIAFYIRCDYHKAIYSTIFTAIFGLPFFLIAIFPLALDILLTHLFNFQYRKRFGTLIIVCFKGLIYCLVPAFAIDYLFYGRFTLGQWNLVWYNALEPLFYPDSKQGSELYGTEPWYYYIFNLLLNFQGIFLFAVLSPLIQLIDSIRNPVKTSKSSSLIFLSTKFKLSLLWLFWTIFVSLLSHKEERFLFPIYPCLVLSASIGFSFTWNFFRNHQWIVKCLAAGICLVAISRTTLLIRSYSAPMEVYSNLYEYNDVNICVGKEWYRYPSSFFLQNKSRLLFLKSGFDGQLPQQFLPSNHSFFDLKPLFRNTRTIQPFFNDENREEFSRYSHISDCDFLIDLDYDQQVEPHYYKHYLIYYKYPFLNSLQTGLFDRLLYIPFFSNQVYSWYHSLKIE